LQKNTTLGPLTGIEPVIPVLTLRRIYSGVYTTPNSFEITALRPEILGLQEVQKSNGVYVHTKPPQALRFHLSKRTVCTVNIVFIIIIYY
jgi:hypothetical protein